MAQRYISSAQGVCCLPGNPEGRQLWAQWYVLSASIHDLCAVAPGSAGRFSTEAEARTEGGEGGQGGGREEKQGLFRHWGQRRKESRGCTA